MVILPLVWFNGISEPDTIITTKHERVFLQIFPFSTIQIDLDNCSRGNSTLPTSIHLMDESMGFPHWTGAFCRIFPEDFPRLRETPKRLATGGGIWRQRPCHWCLGSPAMTNIIVYLWWFIIVIVIIMVIYHCYCGLWVYTTYIFMVFFFDNCLTKHLQNTYRVWFI